MASIGVCHGICHLDAARVLRTQSVKAIVYQTQRVKANVYQTQRVMAMRIRTTPATAKCLQTGFQEKKILTDASAATGRYGRTSATY